ncbi:MAG TPA: PEP-CTERM sorting domain-containing protein [Albitalea sp.]
MSVRTHHLIAGAAIALLAGASQAAVTVSIFNPGTSSISSLGFVQVGNTLQISTTWTGSAGSFLLFDGLETFANYTVEHTITNNSGVTWTRFANELLDPAGQSNDGLDPSPQPAFVPAGFTTSNDNDGLSFAQGSGIARTSTVFASLTVDELSDVRDFLDFHDGIHANGATDAFTTFGLRDNQTNQPFLLALRPNAFSVPVIPEPETYALMLAGLGVVGFMARRNKRRTAA